MSEARRPELTYHGHATVSFRLPGGQVVLIDPWIGGNPSCPEEAKRFDRLDAMLITHAHGDHMGDAKVLALEHRPNPVVGCYEVCVYLASQGVENTAGMNWGGAQDVLGCRVTMVRADHSSSWIDGDRIVYGGLAAGYVIRTPDGFTFYHAGDTALFSDMKLIGEIYRPSLAFLPIGDLYTMDPAQAALACQWLGIAEVVPIHWGTFPALTGTPQDLERELAARGSDCRVLTMRPGDSV